VLCKPVLRIRYHRFLFSGTRTRHYASQESSLPLIFIHIQQICLAVRTRDDIFHADFADYADLIFDWSIVSTGVICAPKVISQVKLLKAQMTPDGTRIDFVVIAI